MQTPNKATWGKRYGVVTATAKTIWAMPIPRGFTSAVVHGGIGLVQLKGLGELLQNCNPHVPKLFCTVLAKAARSEPSPLAWGWCVPCAMLCHCVCGPRGLATGAWVEHPSKRTHLNPVGPLLVKLLVVAGLKRALWPNQPQAWAWVCGTFASARPPWGC